MRALAVLFVFLCFVGCNPQESNSFIDWQGHRGARGVLPENSLEGFLYALDADMVTLEMDVVISGDSQVVVSHEPYMSAEICLDTNGAPLSEARQQQLNLYTMPYVEIARYDCGSKPHPRFPQQRKMLTYKPLLKDIIEACEVYAQQLNRAAPYYNIELKSSPEAVGISQPEHSAFAALVLAVIAETNVDTRTTVQSFDPLALNAAHALDSSLAYSFLYEQKPADMQALLAPLHFQPDVLSPAFSLVDQQLLDFVKAEGMQLIPWTVNDSATAAQLIKLGVDGLITDYPSLKQKFSGK